MDLHRVARGVLGVALSMALGCSSSTSEPGPGSSSGGSEGTSSASTKGTSSASTKGTSTTGASSSNLGISTGQFTNSTGGAGCTAEAACCPMLTGQNQTQCQNDVKENNDSNCSLDLLDYQSKGFCN